MNHIFQYREEEIWLYAALVHLKYWDIIFGLHGPALSEGISPDICEPDLVHDDVSEGAEEPVLL